MRELTARQREVLDFMRSFGLDRCYEELQTVTELAYGLGVPFQLSETVTDVSASGRTMTPVSSKHSRTAASAGRCSHIRMFSEGGG